MTVLRHKKFFPFLAGRTGHGETHRHRLRRGSGFIQERGIGQGQTGEIGHQRLKIDEGFQAALRDFRLIRRVLGVPGRVLENVALDHTGRDAVVITHSDQRTIQLGFCGDGPDLLQHGLFAAVQRHVQFFPDTNIRWHDGLGQFLQRMQAKRRQHLGNVRIGWTKVAMDERVGRAEKIRCGHGVRLVLRMRCRRSRALIYSRTHSRQADYHARPLFSKSRSKVSRLAFGLRVTYECRLSSRRRPSCSRCAGY